MLMNRRGILLGLGSALAAPAIVSASNLMPIKRVPGWVWLGDAYISYVADSVFVALQSGFDDIPAWWARYAGADLLDLGERALPQYHKGVAWQLVRSRGYDASQP